MSDLNDAILVGRSLLAECPDLLSSRLQAHNLLQPTRAIARRGIAVTETLEHGQNIQTAAMRMAANMNNVANYPVSIVHVPAHLAQIVVGEDGELKTPDRLVRSILRRYRDRADIRLLDNLNACWRRFVICKELAHLIMGEGDGLRAVDIKQQLQMAFAITTNPRSGQTLTSEEFAWFVAVEMLLPQADHQELIRRWGEGESSTDIARSYWVPKAIVDLFFETSFAGTTTAIK